MQHGDTMRRAKLPNFSTTAHIEKFAKRQCRIVSRVGPTKLSRVFSMAAKGEVMAKWESELIEQERRWKGDHRSRESADVGEPEAPPEPPQPLTRHELRTLLSKKLHQKEMKQ